MAGKKGKEGKVVWPLLTTATLKDAVAKAAAKEGISASEWIRRAIEAALAKSAQG